MTVSNSTDSFSGDLLLLQSAVKKDSEGYRDEFLRQFEHYKSLRDVFSLKPHEESKAFGNLVRFISHVCDRYPELTREFPREIVGILEAHADVLNGDLRRSLAQSLILMRSRDVISSAQVLPLFFRLFRCTDKTLRKLLLSHVLHDILRMNRKHKNEKANKPLKQFFFSMLQDDNESMCKYSLSLLIELYRRNIWTDETVVNSICQAVFHRSTRIMVAVLRFLLGIDSKFGSQGDEGEESEEEVESEGEGSAKKGISAQSLDKEMVYKAFHAGTTSSRRRKQKKLRRVVKTLKRKQRDDERGGVTGSKTVTFSALHMINDPQSFAERLFSRLRACNEKFEIKLLLLNLISRLIGIHQLILLNFYPYIQKYLQPHQRDVTQLLAYAVQACHELVPPDAVEPLVRQLANQFIHDRARPEVMSLGINTAREICARMPLLMTEDLLRDLALYKKSKEKAVSSAARSMISLFREVAPALLEKKDRGRGADLSLKPMAYGQSIVPHKVPGQELLREEESDEGGESDEGEDDSAVEEVDSEEESDGEESGEEIQSESGEEEEENGAEVQEGEEAGEEQNEFLTLLSDDEDEEMGESDEEESDEEGSEEEGEGGEETREKGSRKARTATGKELSEIVGSNPALSLRQLKRLAKEKNREREEEEEEKKRREGGAKEGEEEEVDGILSMDDFRKIKRIQAKRAAEQAMSKHGLKKNAKNKAGGKERKSEKKRVGDEDEGEEETHRSSLLFASALKRQRLVESRVEPGELESVVRHKAGKEERVRSVEAGREGREFVAKAALRKKKTGGLTNREHQKRKSLPLAVHRSKIQKRKSGGKRGNSKDFKGRKAWKA